MQNDFHSPERPARPQSFALAPSGMADYPLANRATVEMPPAPAPAGWLVYLHGLRRHSVAALGLGLVCAAVAAVAVWTQSKKTYTASALLQVAMKEQQLVFDTAADSGQSDFDIYKGTQKEIIKSPFVLIAALRDERVAALPVVRAQEDPVRWLAAKIVVDMPEKSEIMRVSLTGEDSQSVTMIVQSVVNTYLSKVVDRERVARQSRLDELDRIYSEKENDARAMRTSLRQVAQQLGTGDTQALSLKQEIALEQYSDFRKELVRVQFELKKAERDLRLKKAALESGNGIAPSGQDIAQTVHGDPVLNDLLKQEAQLEQLAAYTSRVDKSGTYAARFKPDIEAIQEQIEIRQKEVLDELRVTERADLESEIGQLTTEIAVLTEQQKEMEKELDDVRTKAEQLGVTSIDVEMMRVEIDHLDGVLGPIGEERERLKVEAQKTPRVTLLQEAQKPDSPDPSSRLPMTVFAALAGLALPMFGISYLDTRKQRINSSADVISQLRVPVIGSVPVVPAKAIRQSGTLSRRQRRWRSMLNESLNGIVGRLLRMAAQDECQVILITSAASGEGKTTLASQLALQLARTGHNTLLVDFDLRRPAVHRVFGLDGASGVSQVLEGTLTIDEAIQPTAVDGLSVMAAGRWNPNSIGLLTNGTTANFFKSLRQRKQFVVIDSGPVLPVADARLISTHVDMVLLSILRDVSRAPQVAAACGILAAFGVRHIESVVTGSAADAYYGGQYGYGDVEREASLVD